VVQVGDQVTEWKVGDRVMALLNGGGYAEQVLPIPTLAAKAETCCGTESQDGVMNTL
jgi:NADPH:quinone reductase-like Zn-dependent oxidoreductase